jgi:hypothetical protein
MERIKNMLERIAGIYTDRNKKTAIDIDLMLDYTRVLYADLLEWKTSLPPGEVPASSKKPQAAEPDPEKQSQDGNILKQSHSDSDPTAEQGPGWEIQEQPKRPDNAWEEKMEQEDEEKGAVIANEFPIYNVVGETSVREDKQERSQPKEADKKEEAVEALSNGRSGISFEPPHPAEPEPELIQETLEEDVAEVKAPVQEIPTAAQQEKTPDPAQVFKAEPSINHARDIRKHIGINDKYLFLNELFNNNKTEYEEALDKLNNLAPADALKWVQETVAVNNKWFGDDETVKSFYDVLDKHFASR